MVVCEVVQCHGPSGRATSTRVDNADDGWTVDGRLLKLRQQERSDGADVFVWKVGATGVEIKGMPVDSIQLLGASAATGEETTYTFKLSDLEAAASW